MESLIPTSLLTLLSRFTYDLVISAVSWAWSASPPLTFLRPLTDTDAPLQAPLLAPRAHAVWPAS